MTLDPYGKVRPRKPSLKNALVVDVTRGSPRARAWPKKKGPAKTVEEATRQEKWRVIQNLTKQWPAFLQAQYREAVQGTALLPRDLMTMVMYGRFAAIKWPDGRIIYPMTARQDISESLDVLAQVPGMIIFRGAEWWEGVPIGDPNQALFINSTGDGLEYRTIGGGGGITLIERKSLSATAANIVFSGIPVLGGDMMLSIAGRGTAAAQSVEVHMRLNGDTTASYDYSRWNRFGSANANGATSAQIGSIAASTAPAGARGSLEAFCIEWQGATFRKDGKASNAVDQNDGANGQYGQETMWNWRNTAPISQIELYPSAGSFAANTVATLWART